MTTPAVPFVALALQQGALKADIMAAVATVLDSGQYVLGPEVEAFERRFAALCGASHAVGVDNGTSALILVLRALGIGPGDEVLTPPNSFLASAAAIALVGARPTFVDVRDDLNIDPDLVEVAIGPRTRAILPVHLTGRPARMDALGAIAARRGLLVIEDAAQAIGARLGGRAAGTFGAAGCFSLHPLKNLGAIGDAGIVVTADATLAEALRRARNHGLRSRDDCAAWSVNARLDPLQGAILSVKLPHLERWTAAKRVIAARYGDALRDVVRVPEERPDEFAVYQTYVVRAERRDDLQRHLTQRGVDTRVHYPVPLHLQDAARDLGYGKGDFPVTERLAGEILSLPIYPELTDAQQEAVVAGVRSFYRGRG
ncbi:MAG TPA: DegT/DnrJ/EryC1/StrS family aminotransferase [Methylomirabilota bacterium]|nr:DegT/DnrJ/EryC1/StrS family aminotransferase [Methylomirabilota bacterium]